MNYKVSISIYPVKRDGSYGNPVTLSLGNMTMETARSYVSLLLLHNPSKKIVTSYEETLFPSAETCDNRCIECPIVNTCKSAIHETE